MGYLLTEEGVDKKMSSKYNFLWLTVYICIYVCIYMKIYHYACNL